jgi:hypothetical protein
MGGQFKMTPSGLWTPKQQKLVVANYSNAYLKTSPELLGYGAEFYPAWNEDAQHLGEVMGQDTAAGSALLAHLSPSKEAEENRLAAYQLVHGISDRNAARLQKAGEHASAAKSAEVRMRHAEPGSTFHKQLQAEYAEHAAANRQLRGQAGIEGTVLGNFGTREIAKALNVRQGGTDDPLSSLGVVKLGDFGRLINDPEEYDRAPIDTHIHDVGVGRTDIPYQQERGLTSVGRYEHFQDSIQTARTNVADITGNDVSMGAFMGGIWFGHQQNKVNTNPNARKARMASETKLANIRANPANKWAPENYGMRPSLVKIAT